MIRVRGGIPAGFERGKNLVYPMFSVTYKRQQISVLDKTVFGR